MLCGNISVRQKRTVKPYPCLARAATGESAPTLASIKIRSRKWHCGRMTVDAEVRAKGILEPGGLLEGPGVLALCTMVREIEWKGIGNFRIGGGIRFASRG